MDATGNVYVVNVDGVGNSAIRKITPTCQVSTLAGGTRGDADGIGTDAKFGFLTYLTVDVSGNVFVTDLDNNKIRKVTPAGVVTTVAGNGTAGNTNGGADATFNHPVGIAVGGSQVTNMAPCS